MSTQLSFFKSHHKNGWWVLRTPISGDWTGYQAERLGFGATQWRAKIDLILQERASQNADAAPLAA